MVYTLVAHVCHTYTSGCVYLHDPRQSNMTQSQTDEALALQAAAGEREAFLQLYDKYVTPIYRFVYFRAPSKEAAEDIVSDVFLKTWKHRARFSLQSGGTYKAWLYTIARRQVIDTVRKEKPDVQLDEAFGIGADDNHADPHVQAEVAKAFSTLTDMQQDVLRLRFWHGLTYEEIADVLGKNPDSCRKHGSRGMRALRKTLPAELLLTLLFFPLSL